jgi:anti-anti-sigma factor
VFDSPVVARDDPRVNITLATHDAVPVLTLTGRFDGYGATVFDQNVERLAHEATSCVLDLASVQYISSIGLRSLLRAEKRLRQQHGGLVLVGLTPPIRQVLEMVGLLEHFRSVESIEGAVSLVRAGSAAPDRALQRVRENRSCTLWPLGGRSVLEAWGSPGSVGTDLRTIDILQTFTLEDLGFAFGVAGFGATQAQAVDAVGPFLSTPSFAGVLPADAHSIADFLLPDEPADAMLHVASALGLNGSPTFALQVSGSSFSAADLVQDVFALAPEAAAPDAAVLGIVMLARFAEHNVPGVFVGVVTDAAAMSNPRPGFGALPQWLGADAREIAPGRLCVGRAALLSSSSLDVSMANDPKDVIRTAATLETLEGISEVDPSWRITQALVWAYAPTDLRDGREKLLAVEVEGGAPLLDEWENIARRLYRDCRRIILKPLHGGYMSKTFHVASYDADGRRMLPTVLKIGSRALTAREEQANRKYVERFILNNSTTILGGAAVGDWAGLRYNFLGVHGPDSSIVWLRDHFQRRPADEVVPLIDALFTRILKPWYGQPRWEPVRLYEEHDPRRLFPSVCDAAEKVLGVPASTPVMSCPELGIDLPNPYHFLQHEFPRRKDQSRLWYTSICHGDLNMQNVLLDERENIYVIDFSETRPRNIVSDLARLETIVKFEMIQVNDDAALRQMLEFEKGLVSATALQQIPPLSYSGSDRSVHKAYEVIQLLRRHANTVTIFETDIVPYWLALLEWTLPVVIYVQISDWQKKYAAYSAALLCDAILKLEATR